MPELPEVETIVADLRPLLVGACIEAVELHFPAIVRHPEPERFAAELSKRTVTQLVRRGKYIHAHLAEGRQGRGLMVVHLGMTGQLLLARPGDPQLPHTHVTLHLDRGIQLRYRDPRRFGRLLLGSESELVAAGKLPRLGPEPLDLDFRPEDLSRRLAGRRAPLKAALLDQSVVAGIGNIYADESCFRARVRPDRPAGDLSRIRARRLHQALRDCLELGISNRGSSVDDFVDAWGEKGRQQESLLVYGRGGLPCTLCGRPLAQVRLAGRSTVFCRGCQR